MFLISQFNSYHINNEIANPNELIEPKTSSDIPNSKSLLIYQYATASNIFFPISYPNNVSFILYEDWISEDITINYEGVSQKKDWIYNGDFHSDASGWNYKSNNPINISNGGWISPFSGGCVNIYIYKGSSCTLYSTNYGFFEQNISVQEPLTAEKLVTLSMDCQYHIETNIDPNISAYLGVKIGDFEKNCTIKSQNLADRDWTTLSLSFYAAEMEQEFPGNVSIAAGIYVYNKTVVTSSDYYSYNIDNVKFKIWTKPNQSNLLSAFDNEYNTNCSYQSTGYGIGQTYIDSERIRSKTSDVIITIDKNITGIEDFEIKSITITSNVYTTFYSKIGGLDGSVYTCNLDINWHTTFLITNPPWSYVTNRFEIEKPTDWSFTHIFDAYGDDHLTSCSGTGYGSNKVTIPMGIISQGQWIIEATSVNYITTGNIAVWNGTDCNDKCRLGFGEEFQVYATVDDSVAITGTYINCTIKRPNGSIFWQDSKKLKTPYVSFGYLMVGLNMSVGRYQAIVEWTNGNTSTTRDKVGFIQLFFNVTHHTSLAAIESYIEVTPGEEFVAKVICLDADLLTPVDSALISYDSNFGVSGTMVYSGSGIYIVDLDTNLLEEGDYYLSFNASIEYYDDHYSHNLIHIKVVSPGSSEGFVIGLVIFSITLPIGAIALGLVYINKKQFNLSKFQREIHNLKNRINKGNLEKIPKLTREDMIKETIHNTTSSIYKRKNGNGKFV